MFAIFQKLGGEQAALSIIAERTGEPPGMWAVQRWKVQRRIPANKAVYLLDECIKRGTPAVYETDCTAPKAEAASL